MEAGSRGGETVGRRRQSVSQGVKPAAGDRTGAVRLAQLLLRSLDHTSPVPLYYQLAQGLERAIDAGELTPDAQLSNEVDLARELGLSRPTVRQALGYLVERGLLIRRRGVGTVVVPTRIRRSIGLTSLFDDLAQGGRHPATRVLSLTSSSCPAEVADALGLPPASHAVHLRRLRLVEGEPLAIMENWLPAGLADLDRAGLERAGLYSLLRAAGVSPRVASQSIGARPATAEEAQLLLLPPGGPILQLRRVSYDGSGRAIEFGSHAYAAGRYSFEMNLVSDAR